MGKSSRNKANRRRQELASEPRSVVFVLDRPPAVNLPVLPGPTTRIDRNGQLDRGLARLQMLRERRHFIDVAVHDVVPWLRERGASWAQIGEALAVTPQAAQQRYGR